MDRQAAETLGATECNRPTVVIERVIRRALQFHHFANKMIQSSVRSEIQELEKLGPLPSEDDAEAAQLGRIEVLYRTIVRPITDDEARVLVELFGHDGCYGLASAFMHLIETAPGWPLNDCLQHPHNNWKAELRDRAIRGGYRL